MAPSESPTRIPRPTFMTSPPRTPSIRAVPYSHTDRLAPAFSTGSYSPSNWPFPKQAKSPSRNRSPAINRRLDAETGEDRTNMNVAASSSTSDRRASVAQGGTAGGHVPSSDPVNTQIYAPLRATSGLSVEQLARSNSVRGPYLSPTAGIPERPMTPTPYSVLRKVSEASSRLEDGDSVVKFRDEERRVSGGLQQQHSARCPSPGSSNPQNEDNDLDMARGTGESSVAYTITVYRGDSMQRRPSAHPLFRSSDSDEKVELTCETGNDKTGYGNRYTRCPDEIRESTGADADASIVTGKPQGITILQPADLARQTIPTAGAPKHDDSIRSGRPTTVQDMSLPDLGSLRDGPRLRHSRLPPSPSTVAASRPWNLPRSMRELWGGVSRLRVIVVASAVLLELSLLSFISSITVVIMTRGEGQHPSPGIAAWAALSGVLVAVASGSLWLGILQYRKATKRLLSGENWIEMQRRSRPLPPRPNNNSGGAGHRHPRHQEDNNSITEEEAWQRFAQDHEQLRRYVEFLEDRIGVLEEGQQRQTTYPTDGSHGSSNNKNDPSSPQTNKSTPRPRVTRPLANTTGSLSRRKLLQPEDNSSNSTTAAIGARGGAGATIPTSSTKTSILTELCEAVTVTEGYSPLSERQPGAVAAQQSPESNPDHTPSSRHHGGDSALRCCYLAPPGKTIVHQRGVRSVDILQGKVEDI